MKPHLVAFAKGDDTPLKTLGTADIADPLEAELLDAARGLFATMPADATHRLLMLCLPFESQVVGVDERGEAEGGSLWATYRALERRSADRSKERLKDYAGPLLDDPDATEADREVIRRLLRPGELTPETIRVIRNLAPEGYDEMAERSGWPVVMEG